MKKILRRITVLFCVAALCVMPAATTMAATSEPVLTMSTDTTKEYTFQPTAYELAPGESVRLMPGASFWNVPAGKMFSFYCEYNSGPLLKFRLIRLSDSAVITDVYSSDGLFIMSVPAISYDTNYAIIVYNQSTTTANLIQYAGVIQ